MILRKVACGIDLYLMYLGASLSVLAMKTKILILTPRPGS